MRFVRIESLVKGMIWVCLLGLSMIVHALFAQNQLKTPLQTSPHITDLLRQYDSLASTYLNSEKLDSMYFSIQKGLALANKSKNDHYQGIFFFQMANYFKRKYQSDSGIVYARKAIPILQRHRDIKRASKMMYRLSTLYLDKKDQSSAIKALDSLLRFNEKHNYYQYTGYAYNLLAFTFRRLNDTLSEKKYILKELEWAEKHNSDDERKFAFDAWATFLVGQKQFQAAHVYYTKSYALAKRQKDEESQAEHLIDMGANFIALKAYKKSLEYLRLAERISLKHMHIPGWNATLSTDYAHLSSLFLATGKPADALDYARRSFALVENEPFRYEYLIRALKNQVAAQKALGHYQDALQSYEKLQQVTYSIDLSRDKEIVKDIEAKYQLEKSEREKQLSEKSLQIKELELQSQQKQAKTLWILLGLVVLLFCGGYWFYRKNQLYNTQISRKNQQLEVLNDTKDKLFGIIGHDLRAPVVDLINTITLLENTNLTAEQLAIQSFLLRKKAITLQTILNNLLYWAFSQRHLLRANPRRIPLKNSVEEALDSLNGLIQEKSLRVHWLTLPKSTIYADENHVQIVLYNILHNAIKFSPYDSTIEISTATEDPYTVLRVTNSGKGFEWEGNSNKPAAIASHRGTFGEKGTGLGLLVCAELMKLNQGTIRAQRKPADGTTLELSFSSSI